MLTPSWLILALALSMEPTEEALKTRATELVAKLGDSSFRVREQAATALLEIGYPAREAILHGQKSADLEISERCKKLYPAIWQRDLDKRIAKFLVAKEGAIPDDLPGAKRWIDVVGDSADSRTLYAQMVRVHSEILLKVELRPELTKNEYYEFVRTMYPRLTPAVPPAGIRGNVVNEADVSLFLFLGSQTGVRPTTLTAGVSSTYFTQFLNASVLQEKLGTSVALRKLFAGWLANERYTITLRRGIDIAGQVKARECIPAILKTADDGTTTVFVRAMAILAFSKLGTKEDLAVLEPFMKEKTVVSPNVILVGTERGSVQIRDVALGAAVQAMGLNLADYGFERKIPAGITTTSYTYYAFASDEKRDAAQKKFADWVKAKIKK